jgi:hypothetical protein
MTERSYCFKNNKHYVTGGVMPPAILNTTKTLIVPWWVEVPFGTTLDDIIWIKEDNGSIQVRPKYIDIKSSSSNEMYQITKRDTKYHCTCPGYYRSKDRVCKHIKQVIKEKTL